MSHSRRFAVLVLAVVVAGVSLPPPASADDKGTAVKVNKMTATAPADGKSEKPANRLRSYQFKLPGAGRGDAEVAIFPESQPDTDKTFPRWKATMIPPEGKTIDDVSKVTKLDVPGATVTVLDMAGTWKY